MYIHSLSLNIYRDDDTVTSLYSINGDNDLWGGKERL